LRCEDNGGEEYAVVVEQDVEAILEFSAHVCVPLFDYCVNHVCPLVKLNQL